MDDQNLSSPFLLGILSSLVQGVVLGIGLTAAVSLILNRSKSSNASTRFAIRFVLLFCVAALTVVPVLDLRTPPAAAPEPAPAAIMQSSVRRVSISAGSVTVPKAAVAPEPPRRRDESEMPFVLTIPVGTDTPQGLLGLYALVVACLAARLLWSYRRLRLLKRDSKPAPPELAERFVEWLRLTECNRRVKLLVSSSARCPMAVGFLSPAVIVPESLLLQVTGEQLDHAGLHELAHLRRFDDWTTLAQRVMRALFFFHPAVHAICRSLEFDREVATDDRVVTITGAAKPYARSLTHIAAVSPRRRTLLLASGAVFRKRQILRRIELILDGARDRRPHVSAVTFALVVLIVVGVATELAQTPAFLAMVDGSSHHRSRWVSDGRMIETEIRGSVEFGDDDVSVAAMSPGAFLRVEERTALSSRKLEVRGGDYGKPEMRYLVDGRERPLDEVGRAWLGHILPKMIREQGIQAEERARRILARRGPSALIEEIDRISSDHSRRRYLLVGIDSGKFATEDMRRAMQRVGRLSSDHEKANLLVDVAPVYLKEDLRSSFFDAAGTINSDHEKRRVLSKILQDARADAAIVALAGRTAEGISSDHEKAQVLKELPGEINDPKVWAPLLRTTASIQSDNEKANVLLSILGKEVAAETLSELLRVSEDISSDSEKARVLERAAQLEVHAGPAQAAFFSAVRRIQSDNDRARVLKAVLQHPEPKPEVIDQVCKSVQTMSSDHDKANVLVDVAHRVVLAHFFTALKSISSDDDKRRVIERVFSQAASIENVKSAVESVNTISSDHTKANLLLMAAQRYPDKDVRDLVRKAAQGVHSDGEYRRLNQALQER